MLLIKKGAQMYKTSNDRRFRKNKEAMRRAFLDLAIEKGYQNIRIKDIANRTDINRMTFYAHYETIEDIFDEFIDDIKAGIVDAISREDEFSFEKFFSILSDTMYQEIDFFRHVAKQSNLSVFRTAFKDTISQILRIDLKEDSSDSKEEHLILSDLTAVCIAYAYLDWLSGEYGDVPLSMVTRIAGNMLSDKLEKISYVR